MIVAVGKHSNKGTELNSIIPSIRLFHFQKYCLNFGRVNYGTGISAEACRITLSLIRIGPV
jgi:hypothetical protein